MPFLVSEKDHPEASFGRLGWHGGKRTGRGGLREKGGEAEGCGVQNEN